jgi:hypothetical protein
MTATTPSSPVAASDFFNSLLGEPVGSMVCKDRCSGNDGEFMIPSDPSQLSVRF